MKRIAEEIIQSPKVAAVSTGVPVASGLSTWLDLITDIAGLISIIIGIAISSSLWWIQYKKNKREAELHQLKIEKLNGHKSL